ncbi:hypothetical protein [Rhizobium leguminosarum]
MMAKLLVASGAPDQVSSGEMFLPAQPKLLKTCASAMALPAVKSFEVSFISACAAVAPKTDVARSTAVIKRILFSCG